MQTRRARRKRRRPLRVRAVLAAGLVLGVGTAATLASWTDTENATGSFGASVFGTESQSGDSPAYASNTTSPGAALTFDATAMSPGNSYFAWLNVRTTTTSNVGGTVTLTSAAGSGSIASALQYRAVRITAPASTTTCNATTFTSDTSVFIAGDASTYLGLSALPAAPVVSAIGAAGAALGYCFEVRMPAGTANSFQGATGSATWTFTADSAS